MHPYHSNPYAQAYVGPMQPPPPMPVHDPTVNHVRNVMERERFMDRFKFGKTTRSVVPSVVGCILVQAVAAFFYITTLLTFTSVISNVDDFSDDSSDDGYKLYVVFNVFFAVAAAMCAPMIQNSGYAMIVMAGTVLMLFSTMSSSLVSTADILIIPYGIFGSCAYGLLRVAPQVAMLDYLNNRRALATGLSYLGVTIGQLAGIFSYVFTDMVDDAKYDGNPSRWQNNLRVIEVTAVVALMSAAVMKKPSFKTGSWPELFQYTPFYLLTITYFLVNVGFNFLSDIASNCPDERDFDEVLKESKILTPTYIMMMAELAATLVLLVFIKCCCGECYKKTALLVAAIFVALLSAASYIHDLTYDKFWIFSVYTGGAGVAKAVVRIMMPLAMIMYTGRENFKIALPFLELAGGLGELIGNIVLLEAPSDMTFKIQWYVTASLFAAFALINLVAFCAYRSWETYKAQNDPDQATRVHAIENAAFEPDSIDMDE